MASAELDGGGIENSATMSLIGCTISGNAAVTGGGVENELDLTAINCTIAGNSATAGAGGIVNNGTLATSNCTIAGNSANGGGGGFVNFGSATIGNSIVAGNTSVFGPDVIGAFTSQGFNLIGNSSSSIGFGANDLVNVSPLLAALGNYGGPTSTVAVLPGSPAIDAGSNSLVSTGITTDQRGDPRIVNGTVDIGAFESQGFTIAVAGGNNQETTVNTDFPVPLAVMVTSADGAPVQGGVVTFSAPGAGSSATFGGGGNRASIGASGQASLAVAANTIAGDFTITASASGASHTSFDLANLPGVATQLVIHTQPSANATAGQVFGTQPVIFEEDQFGNLEVGDSGNKVTAALQTGRGPLQGATRVLLNQGVATFNDLADNKAETISLVFISRTLRSAVSSSITVSPAAASSLSISAPASVTAGRAFSVTVSALDDFGNVATGYRGTVQFTSSDRLASLPKDFRFGAVDDGVHRFVNGMTFRTSGGQSLVASDRSTPPNGGAGKIQVVGGSPFVVTRALAIRREPGCSSPTWPSRSAGVVQRSREDAGGADRRPSYCSSKARAVRSANVSTAASASGPYSGHDDADAAFGRERHQVEVNGGRGCGDRGLACARSRRHWSERPAADCDSGR